MNIYRYQFVSHCPNNDRPIIYSLEIESDSVIQVEHIVTACSLHRRAFHEAIADELHQRFNGRHVLKAHHHGVDIETRRGFEDPNHGRLMQRVQIGATVYEKGVEAIRAIKAISH
jgi:hypothetical protein